MELNARLEKIERQYKEFLELCERARGWIKEWKDENKMLKRENKKLREELDRLKGIEKRK